MAREEGFTMKNIIVCGIHLKSRRLRWTEHVPRIEDRSAFMILICITTENNPLGRPSCRQDDKRILE